MLKSGGCLALTDIERLERHLALGDHPVELGVPGFKLPQSLHTGRREHAESTTPDADRLFADAVLLGDPATGFSPFSLGQLELLRRDCVPGPNRLPTLLGREPRPVVSPAAVPTWSPSAGHCERSRCSMQFARKARR